ncbi:MAG: hypothetical protein OWR52_11855 [Acidibacillus sp.]|nr:hypothetical protein [Acidibacillus sp.]
MYNDEVRHGLQEFLQTMPNRCQELGVKVHFAVAGHPDHVFYLLVEADDLTSTCTLLCEVPMKQEFDSKPVRTWIRWSKYLHFYVDWGQLRQE